MEATLNGKPHTDDARATSTDRSTANTCDSGDRWLEVTGHVYMMSLKDVDAIKIGWAKDPLKRLKNLQAGCPYEIHLMAYTPGCVLLEQMVHKCLSEHHIRGEWFRRCHRINTLYDAMQMDDGNRQIRALCNVWRGIDHRQTCIEPIRNGLRLVGPCPCGCDKTITYRPAWSTVSKSCRQRATRRREK